MKAKCKLCNNFREGICLVFKRSRSSGKKRFCGYFSQKEITRKPTRIIRVPWKSKKELKKEFKQRFLKKQVEDAKVLEMANIVEKQNKESLMIKQEPKIKERKRSLFKKIFSRVREK